MGGELWPEESGVGVLSTGGRWSFEHWRREGGRAPAPDTPRARRSARARACAGAFQADRGRCLVPAAAAAVRFAHLHLIAIAGLWARAEGSGQA